MTRYIYYAYDKPSEYDLMHFSFPFKFKFNFPKIKTPKINTKPAEKAVNELREKASNALNNLGKSGSKKDREWKNHKWVDRKRDKNGKWIYDYGNGFPGEKNSSEGAAAYLADINSTVNKNLIPAGWGVLFDDPTALANDKKRGGDAVSRLLAAASNFKGMSDPRKAIQNGSFFINDVMAIGKRRQAKLDKQNSKIDKNTGLRLKNKQTSAEDDLKKVNPNYNTSGMAGNNNCYACSLAYDLRRRGYEVTAPLDIDGGMAGTVARCYKNAKPIYVENDDPVGTQYFVGQNKGLTKAVKNQFSTEPDDTRGIAWIRWDNGTGVNGGGGHAVAYEKHGGTTIFYDAQTGQKVRVDDYIDKASAFMYMRTDDLEVNYDNMKKIVDY